MRSLFAFVSLVVGFVLGALMDLMRFNTLSMEHYDLVHSLFIFWIVFCSIIFLVETSKTDFKGRDLK